MQRLLDNSIHALVVGLVKITCLLGVADKTGIMARLVGGAVNVCLPLTGFRKLLEFT